jgi:hypothetical protein
MFHSEFDNIAGPPAQSEQVSTGKASVPAITDRGTAGCRHESSDAPSCSATDREAPAFCAPWSAPHDSAMVARIVGNQIRPTICAASPAKRDPVNREHVYPDAALRPDPFLAEQVLGARRRHRLCATVTAVVGARDLGAVGFAGLWADFRRRLPRPVLRCDLIHADMAAELALVSSGMTIPLSRAIFSANDTCAGLAGLEPTSPGAPPPTSAFLRACWSRNAWQIAPDFV